MIIKLENVSKKYDNSRLNLKKISFDIDKKQVIGLIGRNGSGKSTILKMINGLVKYDSGAIFYENKAIDKMSDKELRTMRKQVSYIFQNFNLLEGSSVYYHLSLVYKLNKEKVDHKKIDEILEFMDLSKLKHTACRNLSGGQQQKVAIAMSILQNPQVILCDEISSALDSNSEKEIFDLLMKIKDKYEIAIVMISHNLTVLKNFCDKVILIEDNVIKDIIIPKKSSTINYEKDYFSHVKEFLIND